MVQDRTALFVRVPTPLADRIDKAARQAGGTKQDLVTDLVASGIDEVPTEVPRSAELDILDLQQLSELLRVAPDDVLSRVDDGGLPGRRFGTEWRFSRIAVEAWMAGSDPLVDRPTGFSRS